jgi:hypothetical protein
VVALSALFLAFRHRRLVQRPVLPGGRLRLRNDMLAPKHQRALM